MKIFKSKMQLEDFLSQQLSWRRKELHDLKSILRENRNTTGLKPLTKGAIVLAYAHWEGYIKEVSEAYLSYISFREFARNEVADNFLALSVINNIKTKNKFTDCITDITCLISSPQEKCKIPTKNIIDAESNLNSDVLKKIMDILGLDFSYFETKRYFVDKELLGKRNQIAHGEDRNVNMKDYTELADFVISSMDNYRTIIQNAINMKTYLKEEVREFD